MTGMMMLATAMLLASFPTLVLIMEVGAEEIFFSGIRISNRHRKVYTWQGMERMFKIELVSKVHQ